eukprot:gene7168-8888_t
MDRTTGSSENPGRNAFRQRRAKVAGFAKAAGRYRLGGQDRLGCLRRGVHDQRIGHAFQPPAGRDAVELALGAPIGAVTFTGGKQTASGANALRITGGAGAINATLAGAATTGTGTAVLITGTGPVTV